MRTVRCLVALSWVWFLCSACQGRDDLRPGEKLEGMVLHTWVEFRCASKQQAEAIVARERLGEVVLQGETWLYRAPRTIDVQKDILGEERLPEVARIEEGVYRTIVSEGFSSRDRAEAAMEAKGLDMFPHPGRGVRFRGIEERKETTPDGRTLTIYSVYADWERDLVVETREMLWKEGQVIKYALKDVGEWKCRRATTSMGLPYSHRYRLPKGWSVLAQYTHPSGGASALIGCLPPEGGPWDEKPIRHELISEVMQAPEREVVQYKSGFVARGNDGRRRRFIWQARDGELVSILAAGTGQEEELVRAYLDWLPSAWPTQDTVLDQTAWARAEVDICLLDMRRYIDPQEPLPATQTAGGEYRRRLIYIEQWFDTPWRFEGEKPFSTVRKRQAHYDNLQAWWTQNRDVVQLRKQAPVHLLWLPNAEAESTVKPWPEPDKDPADGEAAPPGNAPGDRHR